MKKFLLTILSLMAAGLVSATLAQATFQQQEDPAIRQARAQRVEALKVAYISQQLNLSPEEAREFWPLYNQYENELHSAQLEHSGDELNKEEAVLNIRKRYQDQFTHILGRSRTNHFYQSEKEFNRILLNRLNNRAPQRVPMYKKGF